MPALWCGARTGGGLVLILVEVEVEVVVGRRESEVRRAEREWVERFLVGLGLGVLAMLGGGGCIEGLWWEGCRDKVGINFVGFYDGG